MAVSAKEQREAGERIEELLAGFARTAGPAAAQRADELVRAVVEFYGGGLARTVELLRDAAPGEDPLAVLAADETVGGLLILHDLHPDGLEARVRQALDEVRPYLGSHAGGVEVVSLDPGGPGGPGVGDEGGVLRLRLEGSCDGCPSSAQTVRWTIEEALSRKAPEIARVEVDGVPEAADPAQEPSRDGLLQIMPGPPSTGPAAATPAEWRGLEPPPVLAEGRCTLCESPAGRLLLLRLPGSLYAYRDTCPACAASLAGSRLEDPLLHCASCGAGFDVRRAGRSADGRSTHLDPVPLLEDDDGAVRISVPAVPAGAGP